MVKDVHLFSSELMLQIPVCIIKSITCIAKSIYERHSELSAQHLQAQLWNYSVMLRQWVNISLLHKLSSRDSSLLGCYGMSLGK
jgi:hypothetical protein